MSLDKEKKSSGTILVVENDPSVAQLVCFILTDKGYTAVHHESAEAAYDSIKQGDRYRLGIFDQGLPGMSGTSLVAILSEMPEVNKMPIMIMTAKPEECESNGGRDLLESGALCRILPKPFEIEFLDEAIAKLESLVQEDTTGSFSNTTT